MVSYMTIGEKIRAAARGDVVRFLFRKKEIEATVTHIFLNAPRRPDSIGLDEASGKHWLIYDDEESNAVVTFL